MKLMWTILVFGYSFTSCLDNLSKVLHRCEETNLVLNWKKCHFKVKESIVIGHKVSIKEIQDNKGNRETTYTNHGKMEL